MNCTYKRHRIEQGMWIPRNYKHGETSNRTRSPEWRSWSEAIYRCSNPNNQAYKSYGARGITVDDRWLHSFANFLEDMGRKPGPDYSLERKDVNGPYSHENCRWATTKEQSRNTRSNVILEYNGFSYCLADWAEITGICTDTIQSRIRRGWPVEDVLTIPVRHHGLEK